MWDNKAATENVASDEKIQRSGRDLQHCGFHLSFILIVITGCDVDPYILFGTSWHGDGVRRRRAFVVNHSSHHALGLGVVFGDPPATRQLRMWLSNNCVFTNAWIKHSSRRILDQYNKASGNNTRYQKLFDSWLYKIW